VTSTTIVGVESDSLSVQVGSKTDIRCLTGLVAAAFVALCVLRVSPALALTPPGARAACPLSGTTLRLEHGTTHSSIAIARVTASGIGCARADALAAQVAHELLAGRPVQVSGAESLEIASSTTCSGCAEHTQIELTIPDGVISVALTGSLAPTSISGQIPGITFPHVPDIPFPGFPSFPTPSTPLPGNSSSGGTIV
jgi:hypothetical protein